MAFFPRKKTQFVFQKIELTTGLCNQTFTESTEF